MRDEFYDKVIEALNHAEGIQGPAGYEYVVLMQRIAAEAARRARVATQFAKADIAVYMRPPRRGERGWWVGGFTGDDIEAQRAAGKRAPIPTPNEALAEVIREMDEGGWRAERDYDGEPDDYGMIAVTVAIGGLTLYGPTSEG